MSESAAVQLEREYQAAREGAILVQQAAHGRLRAQGRDRLDLLHRMSTNDLTGMQPGEARPTVFTTPIARIVDLAWVLNRGEDVLLLAGPGRAEPLRRWLGRHIFFQDEVVLDDQSTALGQFGLFGPQAGAAAEALAPGASQLAHDRFLDRDGIVVLRRCRMAHDDFTVVAPVEQIAALQEAAAQAGALPASEAAYHVLRIEAGQPYADHELTDGYIPLEANLWHAVSFTKGCYIGQEIIARMESRGRLAKTLVGLRAAEPLSPGAEVRQGGAAVGVVTSAAVSPRAGPIALAFVKTAHAAPGTAVTIDGIEATIAGLPMA